MKKEGREVCWHGGLVGRFEQVEFGRKKTEPRG